MTAEPTAQPEEQNAIDLLISDHRMVDRLYEEYQSARDTQHKRELSNEIVRELSMHAAVEEEYLYPLVADAVAEGGRLANHSLDEHQKLKQDLAQLEKLGVEDAKFDQQLHTLISDVQHHVKEEEGELFPKLRASVSEQKLREVGQKMMSAKERAPTHPHPHAPNTPPGVKVAGMAAAPMDKLRDAGQDFPDDKNG